MKKHQVSARDVGITVKLEDEKGKIEKIDTNLQYLIEYLMTRIALCEIRLDELEQVNKSAAK